MTSLTTLEVETYFEGVHDALIDLPQEVRDELLEELPDHLAEVAAEEGGTLVERLGEPAAYAAELRAAAGLEPATELDSSVPWSHRLDRLRDLAQRVNVQGAKLVGYERLTDLARALQPGWWLARGWIVAQLLTGTRSRDTWHGFIPSIGNNSVAGFVLLLVVLAASIWIGTRCRGWSRWPRLVSALLSVGLALWGMQVLMRNVGGTVFQYSSYGTATNPLDQVQDVYVYDQNGQPVPNARLYDQNGQPIQLGSGYCPDGSVGPYVNQQTDGWTYPICPTAVNPFRAGPGPASGVPTPTPSATPTQTPGGKATAKASPSRTR